MDPTTIKTAVKTGSELYTLANELGLIGKLKAYFRDKNHIVVLGSTGCGKSQFIQSLSEVVTAPIHNTDRTEYNTASKLDFSGASLINFVDTPGQIGHQSRRMDAVKEGITRADGIINVVSYGFHEYDTGSKSALNATGTADATFLENHRKLEIEQLAEWSGILSSGTKDPWLITLVTKADLWWDKRDEVRGYYTSGDYAKALGPASTMNPSVCLYSSVRHLFYGEAPVSGYFDDKQRWRLHESFFRVLLEALGKTT